MGYNFKGLEGLRKFWEEQEAKGLITAEEQKSLDAYRRNQPSDVSGLRFMENIPIPIDWAMTIAILKLAKERQWTILQNLVKIREDNIARMVSALAQASSGNLVSAWAGQHNIAMLLEHNYFIRQGGAAGLVSGMNWLTGGLALSEIVGNFSVPATLIFGAASGMEAGALSKILTALK